MGIISSYRRQKITGHKELTTALGESFLTLPSGLVENVYIPLIGGDGKAVVSAVLVGDSVRRGSCLVAAAEGENNRFQMPLYSSVSGQVTEIVDYYHPASGRKVPHLVIRNDCQDREELLAERGQATASRAKIIELIKKAGIIGLGGGGFPTYAKYENGAQLVIINGVECEPYLTTDYIAMKENVITLLEGTKLLMKAAGAEKGVIAVKKDKAHLIAKIREHLSNYEAIDLFLVPDVYPMGWERLLVKKITGKNYHRYPGEIGVIVNNGQTAMAVADALIEGKVITDRIVTVAGNGVRKCANVKVPIGTPAAKIIEFLGGYTCEEVFLIPGGPMMGKAAKDDNFAITPTINGLTVLESYEVHADPCLRCGVCIDRCPAGIMPVEIMDAVAGNDALRLLDLDIKDCIECGMCTYTCPAKIDLAEHARKGKTIVRIHEVKQKMKEGKK